jgi:hypothetical protein
MLASAGRSKAAAAEHARAAAEQAAAAKDRLACIERGEDVAGGLGKPRPLERLLRDAGMTMADLVHCKRLAEVSDAIGFDTLMKAIHEATGRAT